MRTSTSYSHFRTESPSADALGCSPQRVDAGRGAVDERVQSAARCLSSPNLSSHLSDPSLASGDLSSSYISSSSTSLDSLASISVRNVTVLDPASEGPANGLARRVDSIAQRALTQVANAYHTPSGLVTWLRSHLFLGPQKSRREEMRQKKETCQEIQQHRRSNADHGTNTVIATSTLSQIAGTIGLAATGTQFGLEFFKVSSAVTLMSKTICPALTIAESAFMTATSVMRIVRQTRLKNTSKKALELFETDPAQARQLFQQLVGAPGTARAETMRAMRWSLGEAETEAVMVIAKTFDEAVSAGADEGRLNEIAALGLACIKRSATQHLVSAILALLINAALVAISIAILVNPFLAPLTLLAVALSVASVLVSTHRGIQDQSLVLDRLGLPQVQRPTVASPEEDPVEGIRSLFEEQPAPQHPSLVA